MINNKKGFTITELLCCIMLLIIISTVFFINFRTNLENTKKSKYLDAVEKIEAAADAYVMTYKDSDDENFEDIKLVITSKESFCFIPLEEIIEKGFINKEFCDPNTGEIFKGVVKFTKESNGNYTFEYLDEH